MALFEIPDTPVKPIRKNKLVTPTPNLKLRKGQTIDDLVRTAESLVMEKLSNYKDASTCVTTTEQLLDFFNTTQENSCIGIDTETTGLDVLCDKLVGISLCNEQDKAIYIPVNHISSVYGTRLPLQIDIDVLKGIFKNIFNNKKYKWIYHNAKFDLAVFRTFFGFAVPNPYWDTLIASFLLEQSGEHSLKYLYNKYIAVEDEGVNRFDTLFKGITFDYIPPKLATVYAR